jgi:hypothetical protein
MELFLIDLDFKEGDEIKTIGFLLKGMMGEAIPPQIKQVKIIKKIAAKAITA